MSCFTKQFQTSGHLTATNLLRIPGYIILTCLLVLNVKPQTWEVLQIKSTICTFLQKSFLPLINTICFNASVFKTERSEVITLNYRSHINSLKNLHSWTSLHTTFMAKTHLKMKNSANNGCKYVQMIKYHNEQRGMVCAWKSIWITFWRKLKILRWIHAVRAFSILTNLHFSIAKQH